MNEHESSETNHSTLLHQLPLLGILRIATLEGCEEDVEHHGGVAHAYDDLEIEDRNASMLEPQSTHVSLGHGTTCLTTPTGELKCWGRNEHGQLGRGDRERLGDDETPDSFGFVALGGVVAEAHTNGQQTFARTLDGRIHAWGRNGAYELGILHTVGLGDDETPASATVPTEPQVGGHAVQLAVGAGFACVRLSDGGVRCWGANDSGQLGLGDIERIGDDEAPWQVATIELGAAAIDITAGAHHACAVLLGGAVRCWGRGQDGQLGLGDTASVGDDERPIDVAEIDLDAPAVDVVAGGLHTCARLQSGSVRCWGRGQEGQLGRGDAQTVGDDETPAEAGDASLAGAAVGLAAGWTHTCAVLQDGVLQCWGGNEHGQLGLGSTETIGDDEVPAVAGIVDLGGQSASAVWSGPLSSSTCALLDGEHLRCWGDNDMGQLGYGNTERRGDEPNEGGGDLPDVIVLDDDG
jgi:alpha-tubulin suppressor-like RCC1 family protein